jgi:transposase
MSKRKTFSEAFKREAVRLLEQGDKSPSDLAIDLGIRRNQLYKWQAQVRKHGDAAFQGPGRKPADPNDEVARLRKEVADLKEENEILKKAAAYFAKELK